MLETSRFPILRPLPLLCGFEGDAMPKLITAPRRLPKPRIIAVACVLVVACLAGAIALSSGKSQSAAAQGPGGRPDGPPSVGVVTLRAQPVTLTTELPGRVTAYRVADVRPQVSGILLRRTFDEGAAVKAGQLLYRIDPAPYEASLASARATLAHARAALVSARLTVGRYRPVAAAQAVSRQDLDNAVATADQAEADVASGLAGVRSAEINLAYTRITSPITGQSSRSNVTEGALVTANQTTSLVTVTQLDPIYVDVTQPSTTLLRLRHDRATGDITLADPNSAAVHVILPDGTDYATPGKLQFSEVTVDQTTGSVTLRAIFPNPQGILLPGLFVRQRIEEGVVRHGILVPQQAVTRNARGQATVLVVGADSRVAVRIIQADRAIGDKWLVTSGVAAGDRVVVQGTQMARPGTTVKATEMSADG
jgi:membrane fusion protein (multidrug efflux system)